MSINITNLIEKVIWLMTTFLVASFSIFDNNAYISLIIAAITVLILLLDSFTNDYKISIKLSKFHLWGCCFVAYCLLSSLWAVNPVYSFSKGVTIIQIIVCMSILYNHYYKDFQLKPLLNIVKYSGYMIALYFISFFGISSIKSSLFLGSRMGNAFANANGIGIACAISLVVYVYFALYESQRNLIELPFVIVTTVVIAVTASRTALLGFIIGCFCLFFFRFATNNIIMTFLRWIAICILLFGLLFLAISLDLFHSLNYRMEGLLALFTGNGSIDQSSWLRLQFIKIGIEQFLETPLFGIGIDNARLLLLQHVGFITYLHNNYVELLASGGIVGTSLFYSIYLYIIYKLKSNWRNYSSEKIAVLILIFINMTMDFGDVSYYSKSTYFYIMMFFLFIKYNTRRRRKQDEDKKIS